MNFNATTMATTRLHLHFTTSFVRGEIKEIKEMLAIFTHKTNWCDFSFTVSVLVLVWGKVCLCVCWAIKLLFNLANWPGRGTQTRPSAQGETERIRRECCATSDNYFESPSSHTGHAPFSVDWGRRTGNEHLHGCRLSQSLTPSTSLRDPLGVIKIHFAFITFFAIFVFCFNSQLIYL